MAKPTFRATPIQVQVPATSANLGPGFDCFGLALGLHDRYIAQITDEVGIDIDVAGEGAETVRRDEKNLLVKSMLKGFEYMGGKPRGLSVRALNVIPHGRGLGSSASAIVGGLVLARALVLSGNERMIDEELLDIANKLEGHPDNVAAALYGGATIAWQEPQHGHLVARAVGITVDPRIKALAFIPSTTVATSKARKLLPDTISHSDAVANSTRTALLVHALSGRPDLLFTATQDFLHQKYRQEAMPKSFALVQKLRGAGVAAFISGAGPTVLVLHLGDAKEIVELTRVAGENFEVKQLEISASGAAVLSS
ncbi:MAG: homoserine kinase [Actinobacteria bacterium]|uniref:Homoserine kinase n=1 Tax=freshwater metagenome TaxID=449393 RepID=A0A6J7DDL1_9ZZZZ|nr:homoserine kinase [Actinomycetota bacterium]MSW47951.1 homoserine kinase [Actinomycetota bacterium]MSX25030.1 homoserine kinase [Actinomycetota bacterium]MSY46520.1 homoserine kinase [Actinomycetota bacterium]MSY57214.1 homoserine kinase [Actinomycetota bacterium]